MLEPLSPLTQGSFLSFAELFWFMMGDKKNTFYPMPALKFDDAYVIFWKAVREIEVSMKTADKVGGKHRDLVSFHRLLVISLQILTVILSLKKAEREEFKFRKTAYELIKSNPRGSGGWSLLHSASSQNSSVGRFSMKIFPSPKTVDFLVSVGADVNARDDEGNTPLHVAADPKSCSVELVQTLLRHGAHLDQRNNANQVFEELAKVKLSTLADPMPHTTLKCLAAQVVSQHKLNYEGQVPASLESFIHLH